jgi:hypothetical protein
LLMILGGVQLVTIGVLSEMITRVRYEISNKQFYKTQETVNM